MKTHLQRFGWVYPTIVILIAWPAWVVRMQMSPSLDLKTVRAYAAWCDNEFQKQFGPSIGEEYRALQEKYPDFKELHKDSEFNLFAINGLTLARAETTRPTADDLARRYDPALAVFAALDRKGVIYPQFSAMLDELLEQKQLKPETLAKIQEKHGMLVPSFLEIQTRSKLQRNLAEAAIGKPDWRAALDRIENSCRTADPVRYSMLIGHLIAIACRTLGYGGFDSLLTLPPESALDRATLDALKSLRPTDPRFDSLVWQGENSWKFTQIVSSFVGNAKQTGSIHPYMYLLPSAGDLVLRRDSIKDPALRAWADRFFERYMKSNKDMLIFSFPLRGGIRWTALPAVKKFITEVAAREPEFFQSVYVPDASLKNYDAVTLASMGSHMGLLGVNILEAATRGRITGTMGRLQEAAFAARLYFDEQGRWPDDLAQLAPAYLSKDFPAELPETETNFLTGRPTPTGPFVPFHLAWLEVDDTIKPIIWGRSLPLRGLSSNYSKSSIRGDRLNVTFALHAWETSGETSPSLARLIPTAFVENLRAHPKLVESIEILERAGKDWKPFDPSTDKSDDTGTTESAARKQANPPADMTVAESRVGGMLPMAIYPPPAKSYHRSSEDMADILIHAKLRAPERVLTVWSDGPDGKDDRARIVYDPTNGTASAGDIIAFPEGF